MKKTIRRLENAHVARWLIKDYSWCTSTKWLALAMIGPTLAVAVCIAYWTREHVEDCAHNAAICCWIAANVVWMLGEFYFAEQRVVLRKQRQEPQADGTGTRRLEQPCTR